MMEVSKAFHFIPIWMSLLEGQGLWKITQLDNRTFQGDLEPVCDSDSLQCCHTCGSHDGLSLVKILKGVYSWSRLFKNYCKLYKICMQIQSSKITIIKLLSDKNMHIKVYDHNTLKKKTKKPDLTSRLRSLNQNILLR